jgi:hypothetical protein
MRKHSDLFYRVPFSMAAFLLAGFFVSACTTFTKPGHFRPTLLPESGQPPLEYRVGIRPFVIGPGATLTGKELEKEFLPGKSYPLTERLTGSFLRDMSASKIFSEAGMAGEHDNIVFEGEVVHLHQDRNWNGCWTGPGMFGYYMLAIFAVPTDCGKAKAIFLVRARDVTTGKLLGQWKGQAEESECAGYYYEGRPLDLALSEANRQILSAIRRDAGELQKKYSDLKAGKTIEEIKPVEKPKKATAVVAVFDIQDAAGLLDKKTLGQLTEYLSVKLTDLAGYRVIPRDQLRKRLVEEKRDGYKKCFDESCQIELGRAVAAQKSLATKMIKIGNKCAITATLFDLKTETTELATSVDTNCSANALMQGIEQIVKNLASKK